MTVLFLVLALVGLKVLPFYLTVWVLPGLLIPCCNRPKSTP